LATAYRPTHDYCFELSLVFLIANAINVGHAWRYAANINRRITVSFKKRYTRSRISEELAAEIAEEFVVAELIGTKTHGVGKLVSLQFGDLAAKPNIVERGAVISVDGNGGNGFVLFRQITELVSKRCSAMGIVAAFVHNFSRYSSLYPYTVRLAQSGFVGILANTAGPAAVAPFGSVDPITGTNPICFSFPTSSGVPQTFDFATSEVVWGEIRQATLEGRGLVSGPFLTNAGEVTTAPSEVDAVRAFGGRKGWALNLAIEILAGPLAGGRAGLDAKSEFDCGAVLIGIDPIAARVGRRGFASEVGALLDSIRASRPEGGNGNVRCPGDRDRSSIDIKKHLSERIQIPETILEMMDRMSRGVKVSELAAKRVFN
jgi:LDH2 family malate/lactate/ureidoglycolate dehydrogenase